MPNIYSKLSSNDFLIICIVIGVLATLLVILTIIDLIKNKHNSLDIEEETESIEDELNAYTENISTEESLQETIDLEEMKPIINIKKPVAIEEIRYVEENEELEKTKARLELQALKDELRKKEEEKEKEELIEIEDVTEEKIELVVEPVSSETKIVLSQLEEMIEEDETIQLNGFQDREEENAIISIDELKNAVNNTYSDEEMDQYEDEGNEPISIQELEALYKKANIITKKEAVLEEISIQNSKRFQTSPFISPVFGIKTTEDSLELEQTADLEKLNEEIRKTNEFLMVLRDLRKNLE